jgi:hypothetical protein
MAAICAICLIVEAPMKKKGDIMAQIEAPKQDASAAPLQSVPRVILTDDEAKRRATAAMGRLGFDGASRFVLSVVRADISQRGRYDIIAAYAAAYKGQALTKLCAEAKDMGFRYVDPLKFQTQNPDLHAYMKTVAYGIACFGEKGLEAAIKMVVESQYTRDTSRDDLPLIYRLASASAEWIRKNNLIPPEKSLEMLRKAILDPALPVQEANVLALWAFEIDPKVVCGLRDSATTTQTRDLMNYHIGHTLSGKVSC